MPTKIYIVTDAPVNLLAASDIDGQPLDLQVGKQYQGRYTAVGVQSVLKALDVLDGTPVTASDPALPVRNYEDLVIVPVTGQSIFVWSERGGGQLAINEVR